jgi:prepilin-type N-terminal cleavage/methylation domain-containing protein
MSGSYKPGFTFLELVVVIVLLGLLATIVIPNLMSRRPGAERKVFVEELNSVVASAWFAALSTHTVQKIVFDLKKRLIIIESQASDEKKQTAALERLPSALRKKQISWPETIEIQQFFIDGKNDIGQAGRVVTKVWFYIVPDGLSQEIILNMTDASQKRADGSPTQFSLVLNPFVARFKEYDSFQKP